METIIWILKVLTAIVFAVTGMSKLIFPKEKLLEKGLNGLVDLKNVEIKIAAILELLGAAGLILPSLLNVYPFMSGISALCLGLTMIVAGWINKKRNQSIAVNIIILMICVFIAYWDWTSGLEAAPQFL